jgi:hypothetical protein
MKREMAGPFSPWLSATRQRGNDEETRLISWRLASAF